MRRFVHFFSPVLVLLILLPGLLDNAEAIPAYGRKYGEKCSLCHTVWPQLNRRGEDFKINGYQLPESADGDTKGKAQLGVASFLDTGDANPPLSLELRLETVLDREKKTKASGAKDSRRSMLAGSGTLSVSASSTLNKNVAWFAEYTAGRDTQDKGSLKQGYLTINNLDRYKAANFEIGISNLNQHSVFTLHRNALPLRETLTFGGLLHPDGDSPTLQLFGTPDGGVLSYSVGISDNSGNTNNDTAIGGMLRLDFRLAKFAISYNYLGGRMRGVTGSSGSLEAFDRSLGTVQTNRYNTHLLATRKDWDRVSHRVWLGISSEDNYLHNFSVDAVERDQIGYGTDIWLYASRLEVGAGFDIFQERTTKNVLWIDSSGNLKKKAVYLKFAFAINFLLAENAKIGLLYLQGGFEDDYLRVHDLFNENIFSISVDLTI